MDFLKSNSLITTLNGLSEVLPGVSTLSFFVSDHLLRISDVLLEFFSENLLSEIGAFLKLEFLSSFCSDTF